MSTFLLIISIALALNLLPFTLSKYWRQEGAEILRTVKLKMFAPNLVVAIITLLFYYALSTAIPILNWSWIAFIGGGENTSLSLVALQVPWLGPIFALLICMAMPHLVYNEEVFFRSRTRDLKDGCVKSLCFGLTHCLFGVPLAGGLAPALPGLWFTYQFYKGGTRRSTAYHLAYNINVFIIAFLMYIVTMYYS